MKIIKKYYRIIEWNKGSSNVLIGCATLLVVILSALLTDIGYVAVARYNLTNGAEETVWAGAKALIIGKEAAEYSMKDYAIRKIRDLTEMDVKIADNNREITVYMKKKFNYLFLKVFGFDEKELKARVTAKLSGVMAFKGIRPFAVQNQKFVYGQQYKLANYPAKDENTIGFCPINLGAGNYKTNIVCGYIKSLNIGEGVYSMISEEKAFTVDSIKGLIDKCEHVPQCSFDKHVDDCSRIVIIPVVDNIDFSGQGIMNVLGFAAFFLEDAGFDEGKVYIKGRFIRYAVKAQTSDGIADYGLAGIKIIR